MEKEIYEVLKKHKLPLKKREEVLADLLLLFSVSKRSSCCNALIDTDDQSCEICSNCGERL